MISAEAAARKGAMTRLRQGADLLGFQLSSETDSRIAEYFRELKKWNRRFNLIARTSSDEEIVEKHFLDSLALVDFIDCHADREIFLLDVGSGAGFPGLVAACARPQWRLKLVEPRRKRVAFLRHVSRILKLDNVEISAGRIEDEKKRAAKYPSLPCYICGRAVAEPALFLEMIHHLLVAAVRVVLMTTTSGAETGGMFPQDRFRLLDQRCFTLPFSGAKRCLSLITIRETAATRQASTTRRNE